MNNSHMHPKWKRLADSSGWTMVFDSQSLHGIYPVWVGQVHGVYDMSGTYEVHLLGTRDENPFRSTDIDLAILVARSWDEAAMKGVYDDAREA